MKKIDVQQEFRSIRAREVVAQVDVLTLVELCEAVCRKSRVPLDARRFFQTTRVAILEARMLELEDADPALAAQIQEQLDRAKAAIDRDERRKP